MSRGRIAEQAIRAWLINHVAAALKTDPANIRPDVAFTQLGLSSMQLLELAGDLEDLLGHGVPPRLAYEYPTIDAVSAHLGRSRPIR